VQHYHAVGDDGGLLHDVRGQQDPHARVPARGDRLPERAACGDVQPHGGLVEQKQIGLADQCHRQCHALLLAAGERAGPPAVQVGDPGLGEGRPGGGAGPPGPHRGAPHELSGGEGAREAHRLLHHPETPTGRRAPRIAAAHADLARLRCQQPGGEPHQRRLACTVRAQQRHTLARPHGQVHRVQGGQAAVPVVRADDVQYLDHDAHGAARRSARAVDGVRVST
jgi:hypothetical protein